MVRICSKLSAPGIAAPLMVIHTKMWKETTMERPQTPRNGAYHSRIEEREGYGEETDVQTFSLSLSLSVTDRSRKYATRVLFDLFYRLEKMNNWKHSKT